MDILDLTLSTPEENLALDEALLLEADSGGAGEVLRLWELPQYAVILGSACRWRDDVRASACAADGVAILRRCSGGGAVLLGPGCLVYSLILALDRPPLRDVKRSYEYILDLVASAIGDSNVGLAGKTDIAVGALKISGNSQRRKHSFLLHHGTILHAFNLPLISRYVNEPKRQPDYRQQRSHDAFVTNLGMSAEVLKSRLGEAWSADELRRGWPQEVVGKLVAEKYSQPSWTYRL